MKFDWSFIWFQLIFYEHFNCPYLFQSFLRIFSLYIVFYLVVEWKCLSIGVEVCIVTLRYRNMSAVLFLDLSIVFFNIQFTMDMKLVYVSWWDSKTSEINNSNIELHTVAQSSLIVYIYNTPTVLKFTKQTLSMISNRQNLEIS